MEDEDVMAELIETLTDAIINQDLNNFKGLVKNSSCKWCRKTNRFGYTLLQEVIRRDSKEIFDYMLLCQDISELEAFDTTGVSALFFPLVQLDDVREYYVCELIKKGAFIHTVCKGSYQFDNFLHQCVYKRFLEATKLLLEKGIDVNVQTENDRRTVLHHTLFCPKAANDNEFVAAFLCYGADPFIRSYQGYNAFEMSVFNYHDADIQEVLCHYTFDQYTCCKMDIHVLVILAKIKSPCFYKIMECDDVEFVKFGDFITIVGNLFLMDIDYLRILLTKYKSVFYEVFQSFYDFLLEKIHPICPRAFMPEGWYEAVNFNQVLRNLSFLLENNSTLNHHFVNIIGELDSSVFCYYLICDAKIDQASATDLLIYMFQYGLKCSVVICEMVYEAFGYCTLFKLLLHLDLKKDRCIETLDYHEILGYNEINPASIFYDINFGLDKFFETPELYSITSVIKLLDYFAHPKLSKYLLNGDQKWNLSKETVRKIENHPRIPLLVELSRNAFRKYFVDKLSIKSTKEFYSLLNGLQISNMYKKIITLETKLYY